MKKHENLVNFIEQYFERELSSKNLSRFKLKLKSDRYENSEFLSELRDYIYGNDPFLKRTKNELRPLIGYSFTNDPNNNIYYDLSLKGVNVEYFKKLLLYYNKVCLTIHTEFFGENFYNINAVMNFLNFILEIKPLLQNNIIGFTTEERYYNETYDLSGYVNADLKGCRELDLDYVTTDINSWKYLHGINYFSKNKLESEMERILNSSFLNFDLPNLRGLPYKELIAIRNNSDSFLRMRSILNNILEDLVLSADVSLAEFEVRLEYLINNRFLEEKNLLKNEINKSNLMSCFKGNSLNICLSLLGLFVANKYITIDTKDLILLAASTSGPLAIIPYLIDQIKLRRGKQKTLFNICSYITE